MSFKNLEMSISLDDFGTGYSSLIHLRDLPLDKLKIDCSFVTSLNTDTGSAKIVSAILGLASSFGLPTVAEGIETENVARAGRLGLYLWPGLSLFQAAERATSLSTVRQRGRGGGQAISAAAKQNCI
jgi:predicted signal transduction protein with EAL and GGDEF domain